MIDVKKIAQLARLTLREEESAAYENHFRAILKYFEALEKVDTEGVEPMVTPTPMEQFWRQDQVVEWEGAEQALANAPERSGHLFKVPPVV